MPQILAFSSSLVTLKFSIHDFLKTRVLLKIFDAKFPYKLLFWATLPTRQDGGENREKVDCAMSQGISGCFASHDNKIWRYSFRIRTIIKQSLKWMSTACRNYMGLINKGWYDMFVACGIWCLADVSSVSPPYPTGDKHIISTFVDKTHIQRTRPRRKTVFFSKLVFECRN